MPAKHDFEHFAKLICKTSVTWTNDIKGLFSAVDIADMKRKGNPPIDLSDYDQVSFYAQDIYARVSSGSMPPLGTPGTTSPWPPEWVNLFGCWIQKNCPR
jgi:hypothetical protein